MLDLDKFEGHTPGPWSSFAPDDDGQKFSVERLGSNQFVKSRKIATAHHDKGNGEANARLIAAAPELLEMARKAKALRDAAENVLIACGMGWDLDGVMDVLKRELGEPNA